MESQTRIKENSELHPVRRGHLITHASIKELGEDLQLSVKRFLPKISTPYEKVRCLLIAWQHAYQQDEGGVQQDFNEFRDLMQKHYHYEVDEYLVDRTKTQQTIEREMMKKGMQSESQQDELLIIYYTGHSYYQEWSRHTILCSNRMNDPDPTWKREIDFHDRITSYLNLSEGDVLYVIDACYSCSIAVRNSRETLAASAIEMTSDARIKGLQSFTQAFCQTIRADPSPATVAQIHARLISQWQDKYKDNYLQTPPVHKAAASFDKPSIILAPTNVPRAALKPDQSDTPKVLIMVKLDDIIPPNFAEWRNWLRRQIPTNVAEISVEGVFEGNSKVVLLRLPVAIWDMLPDHDAYSFVGYVQSSNLAVMELETTNKELETRVKELETTGKELEAALSAVPPSFRSVPTKLRHPKGKKVTHRSSEWP